MSELPVTRLEGFTFRYAIRMPNGELYRYPQAQPPVEDYSVSSPIRDMNALMSMFGMGSSSTPPKSPPRGPAIFANIKDAEALLEIIRQDAASVGVTHWGGTIVAQLCTPFTPGDPAEDFWAAIKSWLQAQGMDS